MVETRRWKKKYRGLSIDTSYVIEKNYESKHGPTIRFHIDVCTFLFVLYKNLNIQILLWIFFSLLIFLSFFTRYAFVSRSKRHMVMGSFEWGRTRMSLTSQLNGNFIVQNRWRDKSLQPLTLATLKQRYVVIFDQSVRNIWVWRRRNCEALKVKKLASSEVNWKS